MMCRTLMWSLLVVFFAFPLAACGGGGGAGGATLTSIAITPTVVMLAVGGAQQFVATGTYSDGSTQNLTACDTWSSSDTAVGTISTLGTFTAIAAGSTTITASKGGATSNAAALSVVAPASGKIAFSHNVSGETWNIFVMGPGGENPQNLTGDLSPMASQPRYSWDGTTIVFTVEAGTDDGDIYVMDADGQDRTALISGADNDEWPSYSPDGQSVVFKRIVGDPANQKSRICRYALATGVVTELTDGTSLDEMPYSSPDGQFIFFKRGTAPADIYRMDADGANAINLTNGVAGDVNDAPAASPDGAKVAYFHAAGGMATAEIYAMNSADGSGNVRLTNNATADWNPIWSP